MDVGSGVIVGQWNFIWWAYALTWSALFGYALLLVVRKPKV